MSTETNNAAPPLAKYLAANGKFESFIFFIKLDLDTAINQTKRCEIKP